MFSRVLLCYDGSNAGRKALRRGAEFGVLLGAHVYVLSIVPGGIPDPVLLAGAIGHACMISEEWTRRTLLDESIEWLRARGVAAEGYMTSGDTIDEILTFTKRFAVDLIVLSHYPRPAGGFWWSGAQRGSLAERANCCVLVAVGSPGEGE